MTIQEMRKIRLPDDSGVYMFTQGKDVLYVGKATSLRDRVRSYFVNDLIRMRGKHILDMVTRADDVKYQKTDSVLEAIILEATLIKRHQPYYNTKEKDDKSFNYIVITKEEYPRVLTIRERELLPTSGEAHDPYMRTFGPFPKGANLSEALKIVRKIFPFRDMCAVGRGKPCFNRQLGLCPGVCTGEISAKEYAKRVEDIALFFEGKKSRIIKTLERQMKKYAHDLRFEEAQECKRKIFALKHIQDVSLIKNNIRATSRRSSAQRRNPLRIEAYDVAHISGAYTVGVMVVVEDGYPKKSAYRKFKIRENDKIVHDVLHLAEILQRRFAHPEWPKPNIIVIDGGVAQKRKAERVLSELGIDIPVVSVVKDSRHKPQDILGNKEIVSSFRPKILMANFEAHRFAVSYHRALRDNPRPQ